MKIAIHFNSSKPLCAALLLLTGCNQSPPTASDPPPPSIPPTSITSGVRDSSGTNTSALAGMPVYTYDIVNVQPHDSEAFTQGLLFLDGALFESTGLNGHSSLRKVDLKTGEVLQRVDVAPEYFAEGLAAFGGKLFQLTWQNHKGFVYDLATFKLEQEFSYEGEGWGLTTDGQSLILSDGTDQIRFLNPVTFAVQRTIHVQAPYGPLTQLNELEYIKGEIFANVWQTDYVVRINPENGKVVGVIDFTGLLPASDRRPDTDVLNGIAYDPTGDRLFITGKKWPKLFEVRLKLKP
jgi:glutaminyl-peptide cyclotransferase